VLLSAADKCIYRHEGWQDDVSQWCGLLWPDDCALVITVIVFVKCTNTKHIDNSKLRSCHTNTIMDHRCALQPVTAALIKWRTLSWKHAQKCNYITHCSRQRSTEPQFAGNMFNKLSHSLDKWFLRCGQRQTRRHTVHRHGGKVLSIETLTVPGAKCLSPSREILSVDWTLS